jgi:putative membrane protein
LAIGVASAQTTPSTNTPAGSTGRTTAVTPNAATAPNGQAAASGNDNQAVATTAANAPMPAHGANSFTIGQARGRLQKNGFTQVSDLKKDSQGVWRGHAQKDGSQVNVWVDYKGNVGEQQ